MVTLPWNDSKVEPMIQLLENTVIVPCHYYTPIDYNTIMQLIICGDCYASRLTNYQPFQQRVSKYFDIQNFSISNGNTEAQEYLFQYIKFNDGDVFLLGSVIQETYKSKDNFERHLREMVAKVFSKYPNSKIIFWNMAARSDQEHRKYHEMAYEVRKSMENGTNIFCFDFRVDDSGYNDTSHYTIKVRDEMFNLLIEYIETNVEKLLRKRIESKEVSHEMMFEPNKIVQFLLKYPPAKETVTIKCVNDDGVERQYDITIGVNAQGDGRMHLFKYPRLKNISFSDNVELLKCFIEYF